MGRHYATNELNCYNATSTRLLHRNRNIVINNSLEQGAKTTEPVAMYLASH